MKLLLLAAVIIAALVAIFLLTKASDDSAYKTVEFKNVSIIAEVAETDLSRTSGLSGRETLGEEEGMLFMFDTPGEYHFHMKDMNFPIDIIWLDENLRVVDVTIGLQPETYPQTYTSKRPSQYVLETNADFARRHDINVGDRAEFRR